VRVYRYGQNAFGLNMAKLASSGPPNRFGPAPCPMIAKLDAWSKARQPRADGFYWTRIGRDWHPTWWANGAFWHNCHHHDESLFDAIDERRILPPA
jgi:hypothetical protein